MRPSLRTLFAATAICIVSAPERATALEVFGNITVGGGSDQITNSGAPIGTEQATKFDKFAQGFTVGSTNRIMTDVVLGLFFNPTIASNVRVSLYQSSGNDPSTSNPTTEIAAFTNPTFVANTKGIYTFNYPGNFTLVANTSYWIVASLDTPKTNSYDWVYNTANTVPAAQNSSGFVSLGARDTKPDTPNTWAQASSFDLTISMTVIVVPEPSTYALGLVGTLVMGAAARRRTRKTTLA